MPEEVVLVSGVRTPVGKFGRAFRDIPAVKLGSHCDKGGGEQSTSSD